jgi:exosome complex exonuclease RRP6
MFKQTASITVTSCQVFHGCEQDIQWLQRDFGLYVVNCFDTFHAAKLLSYPSLSLAHMVKVHCGERSNRQRGNCFSVLQ